MRLSYTSDRGAQILDPRAGVGGGGDDADILQAVIAQELSEGLGDRRQVGLREQVRFVQHGQRHGGVVRVGADELVMNDTVGVFLRVRDPHKHIDLGCQTFCDLAVSLLHRVEIGIRVWLRLPLTSRHS